MIATIKCGPDAQVETIGPDFIDILICFSDHSLYEDSPYWRPIQSAENDLFDFSGGTAVPARDAVSGKIRQPSHREPRPGLLGIPMQFLRRAAQQVEYCSVKQ
jgi:hypothetical protein